MAMSFLLLSVVWHLLASPYFVNGAASSLELSGLLAREEDTSSPGVVIAGGGTSTVEVIGLETLPSFPTYYYGNAMAAVDSTVIYCSYYCYQLNTSDSEPQWRRAGKLPTSVGSYGYGAVNVNKTVWIFTPDNVATFHPMANEFGRFPVPFEVTQGQCVVSNGMQAVVFGSGNYKNQIWMSDSADNPESWTHAGKMSRSRSHFGCLWFGDKIILTGGIVTDETFSSFISDDTEIFDPATREITPEVGTLNINRREHAMFVFEGKPAVVGGYNGAVLASIETYNMGTAEWTVVNKTLDSPRYRFGLAQLED